VVVLGKWHAKQIRQQFTAQTWDLTNHLTTDPTIPGYENSVGSDTTSDTPQKIFIAFKYKKGDHALSVRNVRLLRDGKVISQDDHTGWIGLDSRKNIYKITTDSLEFGSKYELEAELKGEGGTTSFGEVQLILQ
jgi:hypothetical protein